MGDVTGGAVQADQGGGGLVQLGHQRSLKAGSLKLNLSLYQDASMNNQQLCNETTSHSCLPC